jgi:UDP-N-acetylbacillosamine N-acetyltransferase
VQTSKKRDIYLIGYSGHAYVVIEAVNKKKYAVKGYFDFYEVPNNPYNLAYFGNEATESFATIVQNGFVFPSIGSNITRERLLHFFNTKNVAQVNIIASSAFVSETALLGNSIFISQGAIINAQARIGNGAIINTGSVVEHECKIGNCAHIGPGAVLAGNVTIGNRTFIGANTVVKQGIKIGQDVVVGAGSVIIKDVPDGKKIVGNPGREI